MKKTTVDVSMTFQRALPENNITRVAGQKAVIIELQNLIGLERSILTSPQLLFSGKAH